MELIENYNSIATTLLARIRVINYRTSPTESYGEQILTFSDYYRTLYLGGEEYLPLRDFCSIGPSRSEIRGSGDTVTVTISGVPNERVQEIIYSEIKGSPISVYRVLLDPKTDAPLNVVNGINVTGRFFGRIVNYSLNETIDNIALQGSYTINLECASFVSVLSKFVNGRRTNPIDQRFLTNNADVAFDRIPTLQNSNFVFGAPK